MFENAPLFPERASAIARQVDHLFLFALGGAAFFSVLIAGLIFYLGIRYRRRSPSEVGRPPAEHSRSTTILEATWSLVDSCLQRWTEADLDARFQRPVPNTAGERPWRDRRFIIWHVAEHDLHHGGEISFSLGMHGVHAIDL